MNQKTNLNNIEIDNDGNYPEFGAKDNSCVVDNANVHVFFRNQKEILIEKIKASECIVGCVAWLTDFDILSALSKVKTVAIVVQKEDFLRPDVGATNTWKVNLREAYTEISNNTTRYDWPGLIERLSVCTDPKMEAIRCVGNHNKDKSPAFPRMHNKFLIFGDKNKNFTEVWTGSFNLTKNASFSLENSLLIQSPELASAYYKEFSQIYALSEPLDWSSDWMEPELRIGT